MSKKMPRKTVVTTPRAKIIIICERPNAVRERLAMLIRPQQLAAAIIRIYDKAFFFMRGILVFFCGVGG